MLRDAGNVWRGLWGPLSIQWTWQLFWFVNQLWVWMIHTQTIPNPGFCVFQAQVCHCMGDLFTKLANSRKRSSGQRIAHYIKHIQTTYIIACIYSFIVCYCFVMNQLTYIIEINVYNHHRKNNKTWKCDGKITKFLASLVIWPVIFTRSWLVWPWSPPSGSSVRPEREKNAIRETGRRYRKTAAICHGDTTPMTEPWCWYGCVWKCCVALNPMVLLIIIPIKNGYFIGNIPYFQTNPYIC